MMRGDRDAERLAGRALARRGITSQVVGSAGHLLPVRSRVQKFETATERCMCYRLPRSSIWNE
jgi:hypothetical protein